MAMHSRDAKVIRRSYTYEEWLDHVEGKPLTQHPSSRTVESGGDPWNGTPTFDA